MKTQEPVEVIGPIGMAFYKAFSVADTFVYLPILISGLLLHLSTGDSPDNKSSLILLAAAYGITVYWPIDCLAAVIYAKGSWNLQEETEAEYLMVLPVIALWGLACLAILFTTELCETKEIKASQRSDPMQPTDCFAPILLACGAISPFLYLCNDIMQSSLHPSFSVTSTSVSDLAASDMAHFLSSWLLSSSALCLLLFGIGVAKSLDGFLGGLLGAVGLCNVFTATACRLASPIADISVHEEMRIRCLPPLATCATCHCSHSATLRWLALPSSLWRAFYSGICGIRGGEHLGWGSRLYLQCWLC